MVGVSGGIAAYKAVQLVRLLVLDGHEVHVVPTDDAVRFVGLPTWEAISRNPVTTSVHEGVDQVRHVALGQAADLVIVAPATANTIASMAAGLANNLLGTTLLATKAPVLIAPAMHTEMWQHPATVANMATLLARGVHVVGPESGQLTGADSGPGRMSEPEPIRDAALALCRPRDLNGVAMVVSAGGTREPIDPVRYIGNRSSGRQGVALARAAAERGAQVRLVAANIEAVVLAEASHPGIAVVRVGTASELGDAVREAASSAQVVVMAAAVADYRVAGVSARKLTKEESGGQPPTITLVENEDILAGLARDRRPGQLVVGFAAETPGEGETLVERGVRKRRRKGVDLLAVNEVGWERGFENPTNTLVILDSADQVVAEASGPKRATADALLDAIVSLLPHG